MRKAIDTREFWKDRIDTAAKEYYSVYVVHQGGWDHLNKVHSELLDKHIKGKVLDAGCGYGRWSEKFDDYVGVDFSPDFIAKAKEKYPDKDFRVGNLKDLAFEDKEFDWSFCVSIKRMVMDNLGEEEWDKMLKELKRVSKKVLILEYGDPDQYEIL